MNQFHIKKISEIDQNKLYKFYQNSFNYKNSDLHIFNWRYRLGFRNFEPLVLEVDDEICGHAGLIANDFKIKDEIKTGIWFTDFYINKNYRSLGYGKLLTQAWMKICPIQVTICNETSLKIFKKLSWSYNNRFLRNLKISNYFSLIPTFKKSDLINITTINSKDLMLREIDNQTISILARESENFLSKKSFAIVRDENWFKWRILDCPYKKNIFIFNYKGIDIIIEVKLKYKFKILNIIYISKPIEINFLGLFSKFIKKNNINFISYISNNKKLLNINLPWSRKLNFAFYSENSSIKSLIDRDFDDLQYIDSDIDFI